MTRTEALQNIRGAAIEVYGWLLRNKMDKSAHGRLLGEKLAEYYAALPDPAERGEWRSIEMPLGWRLRRVWNQSPAGQHDNDWVAELQRGVENIYARSCDTVGHATPTEAVNEAARRARAAPPARTGEGSNGERP